MEISEFEALGFEDKDALVKEYKGQYPEIESAPLLSAPRYRAGLEAEILGLVRTRPHFEVGGMFVMNYLGGARLVSYAEGEIDRIPQGMPFDLTEVNAGRANTIVVFHSHPIGIAEFSDADKRCFAYQKEFVWNLLYEKMLDGLNDGGKITIYDTVCNLNGEFSWMGHIFWIRSGGKIPTLLSKLVICLLTNKLQDAKIG